MILRLGELSEVTVDIDADDGKGEQGLLREFKGVWKEVRESVEECTMQKVVLELKRRALCGAVNNAVPASQTELSPAAAQRSAAEPGPLVRAWHVSP